MSKIYKVVPQDQESSQFIKKQSTLKAYDLKNENWIQNLSKWIAVLLKVSPGVLGIFDAITDITYYQTQPFAHPSIQRCFLAALIFTPFSLAVIWDLQFSKKSYKNRDKTSYNKRQQTYFVYRREMAQLKREGKFSASLAMRAQLFLLWMYLLDSFIFIFYVIKSSFMAIIYALLQEIKLLPFAIGFKDPILCQIKFPMTRSLLAEFIAREDVFKQDYYIQERNKQIITSNIETKIQNDLDHSKTNQKPIKKLIPMPQIHSTHPLKAAQIMNSDKNIINTLLQDPYVSNFLEITQLIKAVFQSLPMLIIQYINNSELDIWHGGINIISFILSVTTVMISSIQMMQQISKQQTFPLLDFKSYVEQNISRRIQDPLWLLQLNTSEELQIYDIETLKIAAFANQDFFRSIKGTRMDITSDPEFFKNCLEGPIFPFECLFNIILNMNEENEFHVHFSDNDQITLQHINILFSALQQKTLKKITIDGSDLNCILKEDDQLDNLFCEFLSTSKCKDMDLLFNQNKFKLTHPIYFDKDLESLKLSLINYIRDIKFLSELQYCYQLQTLNLDLRQRQKTPFTNYQIKDPELFDPILLLPLLKNLDLNLENNYFTMQRLKFVQNSPLESLSINLCGSTQKDVSFCAGEEMLKNLRLLDLKLNNLVQNIDDLKTFSGCVLLRSLSLLFNKQIHTIDSISFIQDFVQLHTLCLNFNQNKGIRNIKQLAVINKLIGLKDLTLQFNENSIDSIDFINDLKDSKELIRISLDFSGNELQTIEPVSMLPNFNKLQSLELNFSNNKISNIDALESIKNLRLLNTLNVKLIDNYIDSVDVLSAYSEMKGLTSLTIELEKNQISKIDSFVSLNKLIYLKYMCLNLRDNQIQDIGCMSTYKSLSYLKEFRLDVQDNLVTDYMPIKFIRDLTQLETFAFWIDNQRFFIKEEFLRLS